MVGHDAVCFQKYLCKGLMVAKANLVELDLSDSAFGPNGMIGLTEFLCSSSCYSLCELRLNNNGLGIQGGKVTKALKLIYHNNNNHFIFCSASLFFVNLDTYKCKNLTV